LGLFLTFTILAALTVGFLYGGKSWCQYICPMAPVQKIYAQPRALLNSTAHKGDRQPITQSMCRTVSPDGKELSACVACQSSCIDIDAEYSYWDGIGNRKQQWLYYGYVGLTVGYFVYYYLYAGQSFIQLLPSPLPGLFPVLIAVSSSLWLYRTWQRTPSRYQRESLASRLRKQLKKLNLDSAKFLEGRTIDDLNADEVYLLAKVLPDLSQGKRLQTYKAMLRDAIDEGYVNPANSLESFQQMWQELGISEREHDTVLTELGQQYPELFDSRKPHNIENSLRLESYRETLLEIILHSGKTHPDRNWVADLMKAFSEETSNEVLEDLLKKLSPEDRNLVQELRQEYSITKDDEADALKHTDSYELWKTIAESLGFVEHIIAVEEKDLYRVFQYIDTDRSGYISLDELQTYIRSIDTDINDVQIEKMMKAADTSGDDLISYEEFQAVFKSLKSEAKID
nr:EF-hand domain-containing protein [Trichodesmium sp. MO_231.B1]